MKMNRFGSKFDYRIVLFLIPLMIVLGLSRDAKNAVDVTRKVFNLPSPIKVFESSLAPSRPWKIH